MSEDLHFGTIAGIAPLIRAQRLSPVELTRSMLARVDRLDSGLHSYATVTAEQALAAAQRAAAEIAAGGWRGPLHGVPVAVKDLCFTSGVRTMGGARVLADHVPEFDATVVTRLAAAGAVLLGKLNLTEGAMGGYHPEFPVPLNPWDPGRWAGASSSGSGVATAAGLCFGSLGSDTGGSIRFPAACNGTVGLKPTWGRVSRYGVLALAESLDHVGPLTRSSADAGIMLQAIAGADRNDPTALPSPVPAIPAPLDQREERLNGIRVGFDERYAVRDVDAQVSAAVVAAVEVLAGVGAEIVEVRLPDVDEYVAAWSVLCPARGGGRSPRHLPVAPGRIWRLFPRLAGPGGAGERRRVRRGEQRAGRLERAPANGVRAHRCPCLPCHARSPLPGHTGSAALLAAGRRRGRLSAAAVHGAVRLQRRADAHAAVRTEQRGVAPGAATGRQTARRAAAVPARRRLRSCHRVARPASRPVEGGTTPPG